MAEFDLEQYTSEEYRELYESRVARGNDFDAYKLPTDVRAELAQPEAGLYERLLENERVASPSLTMAGYAEGSATEPDELLVVNSLKQHTLLTCDHATDPFRRSVQTGERRSVGADYGTAALGLTLAEGSTRVAAVVPCGRQTTDANRDMEHPIKKVLSEVYSGILPGSRVHMSLHGMASGHAAAVDDERPFNVILGIGDNPTDETRAAAKTITAVARDYDLRVGVNQEIIRLNRDTHEPRRNPDGSLKTLAFAARREGTTRAFAQERAANAQNRLATLQIELGAELRIMPTDGATYLGEEQQAIGSMIGYLFLKDCTELLPAALR